MRKGDLVFAFHPRGGIVTGYATRLYYGLTGRERKIAATREGADAGHGLSFPAAQVFPASCQLRARRNGPAADPLAKCPDAFELYTPDTVAETVDGITPSTYRELWGVLSDPAFTPRPLGGDGSNGTTEVPDDFSGNMKDAWPLLSTTAKENIIAAAAAETEV